MSDIVKRLREACVGHPTAKIPWPHRILHEAAAHIEALKAVSEAADMPPKLHTPSGDVVVDRTDWNVLHDRLRALAKLDALAEKDTPHE